MSVGGKTEVWSIRECGTAIPRDEENEGECSTVNKNPETDIGIQPEGQRSKTVSHWLLPLPQSEMAILPPGILRMRLCESCLLPSSIPL